ncbi:MT-A70 family methyltransferase [Ferrimonas aestuarii]|uniref:DNA methyltransferase n=1 Tax=Ferrimonas aestuarii TaxID=2569539 RepID=A0A4U1BKV0_9GAMM|nr:MT-A70 family methyltransferase [Ferrimonas aestuarii]TKB53281.1 DNA methyltransferase [Ferrimonas aestuarii]
MNKYQVIYADPPWDYNDKSANRGGAARHYSTTDLEELKAMDVSSIAADNAVLAMWATWPQLDEARELMDAWGFKYNTVLFVWVKRSKNCWTNLVRELAKELCAQVADMSFTDLTKALLTPKGWRELVTAKRLRELMEARWYIGMGHTTRSNSEFVLVGYRGKKLPRLDKGVQQIIDAPVGDHSVKPDEAIKRIERLWGDVPRLEMFARRESEGWDLFGNQAPNSITIPTAGKEAA